MTPSRKSRRQFLKHSVAGGLGVAAGLQLARLAQAAPAAPPATAARGPAPAARGGFTPTDALNAPVGVPFGVKPGRVAWSFDPKATTWDGTTANNSGWWDDANTHPDVVKDMLSAVVRSVGNAANEKDAWNNIFTDFNQRQGRAAGYQKGEKVAIKLNLNQCRSHGDNANASYIAPQIVLPLIRQLVTQAGVAAADITCYDAIRSIPSTIFDRCTKEFPGVHFVDSTSADGREKAVPDLDKPLVLGKDGTTLYFPTCMTQAKYLINIAGLKGHTLAGMTACAKNHLGSLLTRQGGSGAATMHATIGVNAARGGVAQPAGAYNGLVDLNGHPETGGKTVLYLIDALYATQHNEFRLTAACKWNSAPFNGHWTSSLLGSQDGVAIDSVALDFLRNEPALAAIVSGPVDNYLHEMALADKAPSKTAYDPAKSGKTLVSMGVHEHWNSAAEKKYSRNLGTGQGIELISLA